MEQEIISWWQSISKEQLVSLVQELVFRHPDLLPEIENILASESDSESMLNGPYGEVTEEWDFSGEDLSSTWNSAPLPVEGEVYRQRIEHYASRLSQGESQQAIANDVTELLAEGESRAEHQDYYGALELYAQVIDERLRERDAALTIILDEAVLAALPLIETLLSETNRKTGVGVETLTLSPLLSTSTRHRWLERLFTLWLKRLDVRSMAENLPQVLLRIAWNEDMPLLWNFVQSELQKQPHIEYFNIVDFNHQYRTRALEKFMKALSIP